MEKKTASLRIPIDKKMQLDQAAIEIGYAIRKPVKWTEVTMYLIENYLKDAIQDMKNKR